MQVDRTWRLDKHIPVALMATIGMQTAIAIWWAATFSATTTARIEALEKSVIPVSGQADRLTRVEVKLDAIGDALKEVKDFLRQPPPPRQ